MARGAIVGLIRHVARQTGLLPPDMGTTAVSQIGAARGKTRNTLSMIIDLTLDQEMTPPLAGGTPAIAWTVPIHSTAAFPGPRNNHQANN